MNGHRVPTDREIDQQLDAYLRITTDVDLPPRIQEITAMSLQQRPRVWATIVTTAFVIILAVTTAVIAVASRGNGLSSAPASSPTDAPRSAPSPSATPSPAPAVTTLTFSGDRTGTLTNVVATCNVLTPGSAVHRILVTGKLGGATFEMQIQATLEAVAAEQTYVAVTQTGPTAGSAIWSGDLTGITNLDVAHGARIDASYKVAAEDNAASHPDLHVTGQITC